MYVLNGENTGKTADSDITDIRKRGLFMSDYTDDISIIKKANNEMLDYFNSSYLEKLESVQALKTELFELEIKLEELEKTKNIYTYNTQSRKNIFSPITTEAPDSNKNREISEQIEELTMQKETMTIKLHTLEDTLDILKRRLKVLTEAKISINSIDNANFKSDEESFEFIEQEAPSDDTIRHGHNILMLETFDNAYVSTILESKVKEAVLSNKNKLESLSTLISPDDNKAKAALQEIINNSYNISYIIDSLLSKMDYDIDISKPIWTLLDELVMELRESHPECIIEANIQFADYDRNLNTICSINLIKLLRIFFDNVFKHAKANNVILKVFISENVIDVYLKDNGTGIPDNYYSSSQWHSGIHRATEIIYLLDGTLKINTAPEGGTTVRFSFPVKV